MHTRGDDGVGINDDDMARLVSVRCKSLAFHRRTMQPKCCASCKQHGRGSLVYFFG